MFRQIRTKNKMKFAASVAMILALIIIGTALAAATVIDTFDTGEQNVSANGSAPNGFNTRGATSGIGINRDVQVRWYQGAFVWARVDYQTTTNVLDYTSDNNTRGAAWIVWDGADVTTAIDPDGLCSQANCPAGTGRDLTGGGTNDGLHFEVLFDDNPIEVTFRYYSGSLTDYDEYVLALPGGITSNSHVDFFVPFALFTPVGAGANEANIGAFELYINGNSLASEGADLSINFFEADNFREYSDAPATYGTPSHIPGKVRLGSNVDIEAGPLPNVGATGDDNNQSPPNDEDGVVRTPNVNWTVGTDGGSLDVVIKGCANICYLNGWIDWERDGNFTGTDDRIFNDRVVANGTYSGYFAIKFDVPSSYTDPNSYYARFRVCDAAGSCNSPDTANVPTGEVEDYLWSFGPNAIQLTELEATSAPSNLIALSALAVLALVSGGVIVWLRRRAI